MTDIDQGDIAGASGRDQVMGEARGNAGGDEREGSEGLRIKRESKGRGLIIPPYSVVFGD